MMEYFMYVNAKNKNNKEHYMHENKYRTSMFLNNSSSQNDPTVNVTEEQSKDQLSTPALILFFIIQLFFGIIAFQLSWYSNTKAGWSNGYKILFGIIAFMCPFTYISIHILFKLDLLSQIKSGKSLNKYLY